MPEPCDVCGQIHTESFIQQVKPYCISCGYVHDGAEERRHRIAAASTDLEAAQYCMTAESGCFHAASCYYNGCIGLSKTLWSHLGFNVKLNERCVGMMTQELDAGDRTFPVYGPEQVVRKKRRNVKKEQLSK